MWYWDHGTCRMLTLTFYFQCDEQLFNYMYVHITYVHVTLQEHHINGRNPSL